MLKNRNKIKNHMDIQVKGDWPEGSLLAGQAYRLVYVTLTVFHFLPLFVRVQRCEQSGLLPTGAEVQIL